MNIIIIYMKIEFYVYGTHQSTVDNLSYAPSLHLARIIALYVIDDRGP